MFHCDATARHVRDGPEGVVGMLIRLGWNVDSGWKVDSVHSDNTVSTRTCEIA